MTVEALAQAVRDHARVLPIGNRTKPALTRVSSDVALIETTALTGIVEYEPAEYTFTALAGTRLSDVSSLLAAHGQVLPFDPTFRDAGATLGGTVAAGLSGSGRWRHGGVRDFVIGIRFVDGAGRVIRGGGKVVKNAAGFDFPKLFVGSMGRLGAIAELSLKVFPWPGPSVTVIAHMRDMAAALATLPRIARLPVVCDCIDLVPPANLLMRISGEESALATSVDRLRGALGGEAITLDVVRGAEEERIWEAAREFTWATDHLLVKVPTTLTRARVLETSLAMTRAVRRYAAAANVAWIAWPFDEDVAILDSVLTAANLSGVVLRGDEPRARLGVDAANEFGARVRRAIDPTGRFDV